MRSIFISLAMVLALLPASVGALSDVAAHPAGSAGVPASPELSPRIGWLVSPLSHAPTIQTAADDLVVEIAHEERSAAALTEYQATLSPSFGVIATAVDLGPPAAVEADVASVLWPGRTVHRLVFDLPTDTPDDLYDLLVIEPDGAPVNQLLSRTSNVQRRSVRIVESIPDSPRVAVLADPSAGDPRPIQEGVTEMLPPGLPYPPESSGNLTALPPKVIGTTGNPAEGEGRWAAFERAVAEINLAKPDLVLIAGDLTFALHPRALPYEYEDAWQILDQLEVPSYATPGNHDLYSLDLDRYEAGTPRDYTADGREEWQRYFGPLHYAVDVGEDFHVVSMNTFDYDYLFPFPPPEFPTLATGYMGPAQIDWLAADLEAYRERSPDGALVTFGHHDPSWLTGNHPWGDRSNRTTVRALLAGTDVWAHFSGHSHEDRVARYHEGSVVESNGRQHKKAYEIGRLHYLDASIGDADPGTRSQAELASIISDPGHGPLFVSTTSAGSGLIGDVWGLGSYWGWRLADLSPAEEGGYPADQMGYAAHVDPVEVRAFLDAHAERPARWNEAHAVLGVHSVPSFELSAVRSDGGATVTVDNPLLDDLQVEVRLLGAAPASGPVRVSQGEIVRTRSAGGLVEVSVRTVVPAGGQSRIALLS